MSASASLVERCVDRLNPILVKEVRASLRSRVFRIVFPVVVAAAVAIAIVVIMNHPSGDFVGRNVFGPVYGWLAVTVLGIVPLAAFLSMGSEWDENTYDLLVISDLRPRQIVVGKLLSAAIGTMLYFSAFAPVLVLAFLLRGIDIVAVVVLLVATFLASLAASALALAASSLSRLRVARVILLAVVVGLGILGVVVAVELADTFVLRSFPRSTGEAVWSVLLVVIGILCFGITIACERISHQDENHSTGPRVLVTLALVGLLAWIVWMTGMFGTTSTEALWDIAIGMTLVAAIADVFFVTENESMSRRVRRTVPKQRWLALLVFPFAPGGARGLALFLFHTAGVFALVSVLGLYAPGIANVRFEQHVLHGIGFSAFMIVYLGLGSFAFRHRTQQPFMRWMARVAIVGFALLTVFAPAFIGFLMGQRDMMNLRHPLNPFWVAGWSYGSSGRGLWIVVACLVAFVVLALNVPRFVRAFRETIEASRHNRAAARSARDAANAATNEDGSALSRSS